MKELFDHLTTDYWENIQERSSLSGLLGEAQWFSALIHIKNYAYERNISGAASAYREIAGKILEPLQTRSF